MLLFNNSKEAFWVMVSLMKKYDLLKYYINLKEIYCVLYVFENLMSILLPKISAHFV